MAKGCNFFGDLIQTTPIPKWLEVYYIMRKFIGSSHDHNQDYRTLTGNKKEN